MWCEDGGDFKVRTALKATIPQCDTTIVVIPACKCPSRGKQTFSHDEKSCKKSQRLAKVHLRLFTQPCSALYPVASYRRSSYQSVVVSAMQPCGHTVIQRCELALGCWPAVTASLIIFMSLVPLLHSRCSCWRHLLAQSMVIIHGLSDIYYLFLLSCYIRPPYKQIQKCHIKSWALLLSFTSSEC